MLNALASPMVPGPVIKMVGLQPALAEELRRRFPEDFDIEILRDHARLSQYMEQGGLPVDAVLLGMRPEEAVRVAQRIHAMDKFMPVMIVGRAWGICTLNNVCQLEDPKECAASTISRGTLRIPRSVNRITGGMA